MRKLGVLVMVIGVAAMAGLYVHQRGGGTPGEDSAGVLYQCPMHPQIVSKTPGNCPICHMSLERVERGNAEDGREEGAKAGGGEGAVSPKTTVPGHAAFELSSARQRLIGVKTARVEMRELVLTIPAAGRIQDSKGRVSAEVFEFEAGRVHPGQKAEVISSDVSGLAQEAEVVNVGASTDPATRTVAVYLRLRKATDFPAAGSLVEVRIKVGLGRGLAVPHDAVLDTGDHKVAFVRRGEGIFDPRALELGRAGDSDVEVLKGLAEGEEVVVGANFLIDSESRFRAAGEEYGKHAH